MDLSVATMLDSFVIRVLMFDRVYDVIMTHCYDFVVGEILKGRAFSVLCLRTFLLVLYNHLYLALVHLDA